MRHVISLSGGKDSTAVALLMKEKKPNMDFEFIFADSGCELPETYEYLKKLEVMLGDKIVKLGVEGGFDGVLEKMNGFLPSPVARWCTRELKIKPIEQYLGHDKVKMYLGIRIDEKRKGYVVSRKNNIIPSYPLQDARMDLKDVENYLNKKGIGLPKYYSWRTRSGCYFCFYQRIGEWFGLYKNHPELFQKAKAYEKDDFTWRSDKSLEQLQYEFEHYHKYLQKDMFTDYDYVDDLKPLR